MRKLLYSQIIKFLKNQTSFFLTEEEIKILLALYLTKSALYTNVFIEYNVNCKLLTNYPWKNDKKIAVDIVVQQNDYFIPIEIKFKTKEQTLHHHVFGTLTNMKLANQKAINEGCYGFWKDVKRMEILKETFRLKYSGLVLFVTNDSQYQRQPKKNVQYEPFSIYQKRQIAGGTILNWNESKKPITESRHIKFPPIKISNNYEINWHDMSLFEHKFLLL